MLAKRIIPCLDVKDGRVVKGVRFVDLRDAGDPVEAALAYDAQGADELVFLDITASHEDRDIMLDVVRRTAEGIYMPLTVGGGIRSVDDVRRLLRAGADKVSLNTAALARPALIREAAERFGSQCIVVAIDARREPAAGAAHAGASTPRRPAARRARRRRVGAGGRRARRRRDPPDQHGPRRHQGRLRPRADARGRRGRDRAGHRLRRRRLARAPLRGRSSRAAPTPRWPRRIFHFGIHTIAEAKAYLRERGVEVRLEP